MTLEKLSRLEAGRIGNQAEQSGTQSSNGGARMQRILLPASRLSRPPRLDLTHERKHFSHATWRDQHMVDGKILEGGLMAKGREMGGGVSCASQKGVWLGAYRHAYSGLVRWKWQAEWFMEGWRCMQQHLHSHHGRHRQCSGLHTVCTLLHGGGARPVRTCP